LQSPVSPGLAPELFVGSLQQGQMQQSISIASAANAGMLPRPQGTQHMQPPAWVTGRAPVNAFQQQPGGFSAMPGTANGLHGGYHYGLGSRKPPAPVAAGAQLRSPGSAQVTIPSSSAPTASFLLMPVASAAAAPTGALASSHAHGHAHGATAGQQQRSPEGRAMPAGARSRVSDEIQPCEDVSGGGCQVPGWPIEEARSPE
jgi:hypothetical protein